MTNPSEISSRIATRPSVALRALKDGATSIARLGAAIILPLLLLLACGCSAKTPYEVLEDSVIAEMNAYVYADRSITDHFIEYMDIGELEQFGVDAQAFAASFLSDFDYRIDLIRVTEDDADAQITLISKDYGRFEEMLQERSDALAAQNSKGAISQDRFKKMYGDAIMECIDGDDALVRSVITISYHKDGDTWRPTSEIFYLVMDALVSPESTTDAIQDPAPDALAAPVGL